MSMTWTIPRSTEQPHLGILRHSRSRCDRGKRERRHELRHHAIGTAGSLARQSGQKPVPCSVPSARRSRRRPARVIRTFDLRNGGKVLAMSAYDGGAVNTPHASPSARRGRWGTGPKVLTWIGALILAVSVAAGVLGASTFLSVLPLGVVDAQGRPGANALGGGEVPGSAEISVGHGDVVVIWEVAPASASRSLAPEDVRVTGAGGEVPVARAEVSGTSRVGSVRAETFAQFRAPAAGDYTIEVGAGAGEAEGFVVAEGDSFPAFFGGLFATIGLWFLALGGGVLGVCVLAGGIVWGMVRARRPA